MGEATKFGSCLTLVTAGSVSTCEVEESELDNASMCPSRSSSQQHGAQDLWLYLADLVVGRMHAIAQILARNSRRSRQLVHLADPSKVVAVSQCFVGKSGLIALYGCRKVLRDLVESDLGCGGDLHHDQVLG